METVFKKATMNTWIAIIAFAFWSCQDDNTNNSSDNANVQNDTLAEVSDYPIVETAQNVFYGAINEISEPEISAAFYGQDACYSGNTPEYVDNGNGTISDMVTGLMWQKTPDTNGDGTIDADDKKTYSQALQGASELNLGGYTDWRLPTIKELYSLIMFSGKDPSGYDESSVDGLIPFINTDYFDFAYGDTDAGERIIDAQFASSTKYVHYTMNGDETVFGVNFADGRIKGYGLQMPFGNADKTFFVIYVRGNENYGINNFVDNGNGTISDLATGLMWMQNDSGEGMNWQEALAYAENLDFAGYDDWKLPDVKELQSIVDYTRSPATTNSAAIDPIFNCTAITNEAGESDYPFYWSGTTHANWTDQAGGFAAYVSFGRAMGYMDEWMDVHGAGAQRSDPKTGNAADYPYGNGPQGDAIRINNFVRAVRLAR